MENWRMEKHGIRVGFALRWWSLAQCLCRINFAGISSRFDLDGHTGYMQLAYDTQRYNDVLTRRQTCRYKVWRSKKRVWNECGNCVHSTYSYVETSYLQNVGSRKFTKSPPPPPPPPPPTTTTTIRNVVTTNPLKYRQKMCSISL